MLFRSSVNIENPSTEIPQQETPVGMLRKEMANAITPAQQTAAQQSVEQKLKKTSLPQLREMENEIGEEVTEANAVRQARSKAAKAKTEADRAQAERMEAKALRDAILDTLSSEEHAVGEGMTAHGIFQQSEAEQQKEFDKDAEELDRAKASRRKSLGSLVSDDENLPDNEQVPISKADARQAQRMLSRDMPGAELASVYNADEFIQKFRNWPGMQSAVAMVEKGLTEGIFMSRNGMAYIFPDLIRLRQSDVRVAAELGISPEVAAARRVLIHEGFVHYGFRMLDESERQWLKTWVLANSTGEEIDALKEKYPQTNNEDDAQYNARLIEERLASIIEKTGKWPSADVNQGMWERLKAFLQRVWNRITGKQIGRAHV